MRTPLVSQPSSDHLPLTSSNTRIAGKKTEDDLREKMQGVWRWLIELSDLNPGSSNLDKPNVASDDALQSSAYVYLDEKNCVSDDASTSAHIHSGRTNCVSDDVSQASSLLTPKPYRGQSTVAAMTPIEPLPPHMLPQPPATTAQQRASDFLQRNTDSFLSINDTEIDLLPESAAITPLVSLGDIFLTGRSSVASDAILPGRHGQQALKKREEIET